MARKLSITTRKNTGFTLVETLVSVAVFTLIFLAVYGTYAKIFELIALSRTRAIAMAYINEQIEIARNLPYGEVGTPAGIPKGVIEPFQTVTRNNITFEVTTVVRNIDDPFDGLIGGAPNDISPADYKLVDMTIECITCKNFPPFSVVSYIAPKNLEISTSTNGALFIDVVDASGQPIVGAFVHVENASETPPIIIDDVSGTNGLLQLIDIPPGVEVYDVSVTKDGYTTDMTLPRGAGGNPNPTKPFATVIPETVTALTMTIDRKSIFDFSSKTEACVPVSHLDFALSGTKLIGTSPDVKKYDAVLATDASGSVRLTDMEWDTYALTVIDPAYQLIGTNSLSPVTLLPGETKTVDLIVSPKVPNTLMVTVKDGATDLPISNATVNISGNAVNETRITGRGFLKQTDWSGGAGQATSTDPARYFSSDGNVAVSSPAGEVKLRETFGVYQGSGELISSSFDTGSPSNFHEITWLPLSQPPPVGTGVHIQIATNDDGGVWNFVGPDGTAGSFYEVGTSTIHMSHNNDQYLRYRMLLSTASTSYTPNVSDVAFTFTSSCVPPGQVAFDGLAQGDYNIAVTHPLYAPENASTTISGDWQSIVVTLTP